MATIIEVSNSGPDEVDVVVGKGYTRHLRAGERVSLSLNGGPVSFANVRKGGGRDWGGGAKLDNEPDSSEPEV